MPPWSEPSGAPLAMTDRRLLHWLDIWPPGGAEHARNELP
jgi:hypothetical protein